VVAQKNSAVIEQMAQWLKFDVLLPLWTLFLSTGEDQVIVVVSQKGQQMVC